MKKQYLVILFISIFATYSGAEGKKESQGNLSTTNVTSFSSSTAQGGGFISPYPFSTHYGGILFSIEAYDYRGVKTVSLRFRQNGRIIGNVVLCNDNSLDTCKNHRITKNVTVNPADYGATDGQLEVDLLLVHEGNQQSKLATLHLNWGRFAFYGTFISPYPNLTHYGVIPFLIEAFDSDGIKTVNLRFRQDGRTLGNHLICDNGGSNNCKGRKTIRERGMFHPVDYGVANGAFEVDLWSVDERNQQSELATVSILNWERLEPYGTFISPRINSKHGSAILFSIEAFDDDGLKQVGMTFKQNGIPFANLVICNNASSACIGNRINKDVTVNPAEYGIDNGTITIDLWSIDGRDLNNGLATLNLQWEVSQGRLNDTGINWGGDYASGNNTTCISNMDAAQDCHQGRDAQAAAGKLTKRGGGHAGFDFTKLDSNGNALIKQDATWDDNGNASDGTQWSCVRDNHTGLIWEVKTNDGSIHNANKMYKWGGKTAIGKGHEDAEGNYDDNWNELVDGANSKRLCGFNDWRVPDHVELRSIVDYSRVDPVIDTSYFPNTVSDQYWSSSPHANYSDFSWVLHFNYGRDGYSLQMLSWHVRLVRVGQ